MAEEPLLISRAALAQLLATARDALARLDAGDSARPQVAALIGQLEQLAQGEPGPRAALAPAATGAAIDLLAGAGEELYPNGISGASGLPLLRIDAAAAAALAQGGPGRDAGRLEDLHRARMRSNLYEAIGTEGVIADISMANLAESRWAVVVNANDDAALIKALSPLIAQRSAQQGIALPPLSFRAGESCGEWHARNVDMGLPWEARPPVLLYYPGQSASQWLGQYGILAGPVDPARGVPFYLALLGRPGPLQPDDTAFISYGFQYELDIFWGVGRICFTGEDGRHRLADYTAYAERLVGWEQRGAAAAERLSKEVAYFGTRHETDVATQRSAAELIAPLAAWHAQPGSLPQRQGFGQRLLLGEEASRATLSGLLSSARPPAMLFSATHGVGFPVGDGRLVGQQGGLVCSEWEGFGRIKPEHWLAGADVAALGAQAEGMIALIFACYGAGSPQHDEFIFDAQRGRPPIAPFAFVAQLPQQLLLKGCLAVLGHVERAWSYSFSGRGQARAQIQGFQDIIGRLSEGKRAGEALDQFNVIQAARAVELITELENISFGKQVRDSELATLWMARNDARNYALLGDPAAKLPF
jgi:hypothetical protein